MTAAMPPRWKSFADHYRAILEKTRRLGAGIILIEPFLLPVPADRRGWRVDLDPKIQAVRDLAREFAACLRADGWHVRRGLAQTPGGFLAARRRAPFSGRARADRSGLVESGSDVNNKICGRRPQIFMIQVGADLRVRPCLILFFQRGSSRLRGAPARGL